MLSKHIFDDSDNMGLTETGSVLEIHAFVTAGMTRIEIQS
jgi:hypothetical protein